MRKLKVNALFPLIIGLAVWFVIAGWVDWRVALLIFLCQLELTFTWERRA